MKTSIDLDQQMLEVIDEICDRETRNSRSNAIQAAITDYVRTKHPDLLPRLQK